MISNEALGQLARQYQTSIAPNIIREYFQHIFLSELYKLPGSEQLLFKGGTALRIIYGSPRFSKDLDFSLFGVPPAALENFVEVLFIQVLTEIKQIGIEVKIGSKPDTTSRGYFGTADFTLSGFNPVNLEINVFTRNSRKIKGEVDLIASNFIPPYTLVHLPQDGIVDEKIFGALLDRKKPRDFYDLYFMMRKGMLTIKHKQRLSGIKSRIINEAKKADLRGELTAFLPAGQQTIIRNFPHTLESELNRL